MKTLLSLGLLCFVAATAQAQTDSDRDKPLGEDTVKVSDHVWQIVGWPNIGIVVGEKATLVVNTGLGPAMAPRSREWRNDLRPTTSSI